MVVSVSSLAVGAVDLQHGVTEGGPESTHVERGQYSRLTRRSDEHDPPRVHEHGQLPTPPGQVAAGDSPLVLRAHVAPFVVSGDDCSRKHHPT